MNKRCIEKTCEQKKPLGCFSKDKSRKDGLCVICKTCAAKKHKEWYEQNQEKEKERVRNYNKTHKEEAKIYRAKTFEHRSLYMKEWRQRKKEHRRIYRQKYNRRRTKEDINFRILHNLRTRVLSAIKNNSKRGTTMKLLGCTITFLKIYLSSKFANGMTWDNYGKGEGKWNMDHIIPCDKFDFSKKEDQEACFHYTNLQPLWSIDNSIKGNRIAR